MSEFSAALSMAADLILRLDASLVEIVGLSLSVSLTAVGVATLVALPAGALLALASFPGRGALIVLLNGMMGLPPVVVGLVVYLLLSRSGPLGVLGLLFTPTAMIIAQTVLVAPLITALARQAIADAWRDLEEQLRSLGARPARAVPTLLWEARGSLSTAVLAGFGRAIAEVGAVLIVGGNIDHVTRTMTTTIALETSKGNLALALGLGIVLLLLALLVNAAASLASAAAAPASR